MANEQISFLEKYSVSLSDERLGFLKILGYGSSGTGKTSLGATMPGKTAVLAGEKQGGLALKRRAFEIGKADDDVKIFHIEDKKDEAGRVVLGAMDFVYGVIDELERGEHDFTSLVFDSLSDFQDLVIRSLRLDKGGLDKTLSQADWGYVIEETRNLCLRLRDLRMHVYVIALATSLQDDNNRMVWRPALAGRKLPDDLPQYFNLVGRTVKHRLAGGSGRAKYSVVLEGGDEAYTKGHPALDPEEQPDVSAWAGKLSEFGQERGEGVVPAKAEPTKSPAELARYRLMNDPEITSRFNQLRWLPAKRRAACDKYPSRDELLPRLDAYLKEPKTTNGHSTRREQKQLPGG